MTDENSIDGIAIIGMAGRFPGAKDIETYWQNLCNGVESIRFFSDDELAATGIAPELLKRSNYVKAAPVLDHIDMFDAAFFGINPREAETIDPQQRFFLESAWEALENAGYVPEQFQGRVGVYAGASLSSYLLMNFALNPDILAQIDGSLLMMGNDKDYLTTRVSYKLNLTGPSLNVQTACSTSLVAVALACQGLLQYQCDMALAGGVSISVPQNNGYLYFDGGIISSDGHCRAFDAQGQGTIFGSGVGIVVLKRLTEAIEDGDTIYAVIRGSAINNDGAAKVGFTAPGVDGQAEVIADALAVADVQPESIGYVEAHGTATALGDPIEIAALTQAFRASTQKNGFCAIGSAKTNIGHLNMAAGIAGLIKTTLALKNHQIPASLHFDKPNPNIDFDNSPFYVNTKLAEWPSNGFPRRAGISSFGIGGTNAHLILEEAPTPPLFSQKRGGAGGGQIILLSAKTEAALDAATENLQAYLSRNPAADLADVAYTLQVGRAAFHYRRAIFCQTVAEALAALETRDASRILTGSPVGQKCPVVFMFPGQGSQYVNMTAELYQQGGVFQREVDRCCELLQPQLGLDLRQVIYSGEENAQQLNQTSITQPAMFVIEYALAKLLISWGIQPQAMIGHSIGEYVAACLAGVFSLSDALTLVAARGRLMQSLPDGEMLAVFLPEADVCLRLGDALSLAAVNAPTLSVVSGPVDAVRELEARLAEDGIGCRRLLTSHAFHSTMMEPILDAFAAELKKVQLRAPKLPFISNLTGTWISAAEAVDPQYWAAHLRQTVRFADGIQQIVQDPGQLLLEVGPGTTLSTLARQCASVPALAGVLSTVRHPQDQTSDQLFLLQTLGKLWLSGCKVNWSGYHAGERRQRIPLPTYPFQRQRYWLGSAPGGQISGAASAAAAGSGSGVSDAPTFTSRHPRPALLTAYVPPTSEMEQMLVDIWGELLGIDEIGIQDNFFELGGHSLIATQLFLRLSEQYPVELPLRSLFETPTIARLAETIEEKLIEMLEAMSEEEALQLTNPEDQPGANQ